MNIDNELVGLLEKKIHKDGDMIDTLTLLEKALKNNRDKASTPDEGNQYRQQANIIHQTIYNVNV